MKILVSRPDKIGDVLLAMHGVKQLKQILADSEVYVHVSAYTRPLIEKLKFIDGVVEFGEDLRPYNFDAVVDLMAKNETAKIYHAAGIPLRIGNSARWFRFRYNRTRYIRRSRATMNEAEYNWQLLSALDETLTYLPLNSVVSAEDFSDVSKPARTDSYTVLMPGVSVSAFGWQLAEWKDLARKLADSGQEVQIVLGPAEKNQLSNYEELCAYNQAITVSLISDFSELLGILALARKYVGPSTGVTHLASAFGLEGIALYPETRSMHPRRWLPFRTKLRPLSLTRGVKASHVFEALDGNYSEHYNPMPRADVSAFVVCCNEEKNIRRCLDSISWCDEIIVVDSGSTDRTLDIVSEYTDKIFHRAWTGHSQQKQFALDKCSKEWILNIDSDEQVSMELKSQLLRILSLPDKKRNKVTGYNVCRMVHFLDRWWDRGGWFPEYRLRFFRRLNARWGGVNPHEKALVEGPLRKLHEPIFHFTYRDFTHQIDTLNKHSSLSANCLYNEGKRCYLLNLILNPPFRFFKFYVLKMGFREGIPGLIVAGLEASYTLFKYVKLWELQRAEGREIQASQSSDQATQIKDAA